MAISTSTKLGEQKLSNIIKMFIGGVDSFPTSNQYQALSKANDVIRLIETLDLTQAANLNTLSDSLVEMYAFLDTPNTSTNIIFNASHQLELYSMMAFNEIQSVSGVGVAFSYGSSHNDNISSSSNPSFETEIPSVLSGGLWSSDIPTTNPLFTYGNNSLWVLGETLKKSCIELGEIMMRASITSTMFTKEDPDYELPAYSGNENTVKGGELTSVEHSSLTSGAGYPTNGLGITLNAVSSLMGNGAQVVCNINSGVVTSVTSISSRGNFYENGETLTLMPINGSVITPATIDVNGINITISPTSPGQEDPTSGDGEILVRTIPEFLTSSDEDTPSFMHDAGELLHLMAQSVPDMNTTITISQRGAYRKYLDDAKEYFDLMPFVTNSLEQDKWLFISHLSNQIIYQDLGESTGRVIPV